MDNFSKTPIGQLLAMGFSDTDLAEKMFVTPSAAWRWRHRYNNATAANQFSAQVILDRHKAFVEVVIKQPNSVEISPSKSKETIFMVSVPEEYIVRFNKIMQLLNIQSVNLDEE